MKYSFLIIISICLAQTLKAQDSIPSVKDVIVGRWVESRRINGDSVKDITEYADTYIFRDNMMFHKGEASEGVILFNTAGSYRVTHDTVSVFYQDYARPDAANQKAKVLMMKVLSCKNNELQVRVKDYDYEYEMVLKK